MKQRLEFLRHTPPRQVLRRMYIRGRRKILDRILSPSLTIEPKQTIAKRLTLPHLYAPHGTISKTDKGWSATFLGESFDMGEHLDWNCAPSQSRGQLWLMNLHYFEYLPDIPSPQAAQLIEDWITKCRPCSPVSSYISWTPYAISLRISAWVDYWSTHSPFGSETFQKRFSASLREQARYLQHNLETDVRGNHLIKNIRALYEAAASFNDNQARKWAKIADHHLQKELGVQILDDGMHFELSASYHAQVFADLLTIATIRLPDSFTPRLNDGLKKMALALEGLTHPDGYPVQFNDSGLTMCVPPQACLKNFESQLKTCSNSEGEIHLPTSGFFGISTQTDYLISKFGRLGPNSLMAHAHGDWGSFEWSHAAERIFVDQGVFEYIDGEKRHLSRSTSSHNTAQINGLEQADFFDAFRCGVRPNPPPAAPNWDGDHFKISGELKLPAGPMHQREISLEPGQLRIIDYAEASTDIVTSTLLLHPGVSVLEENGIYQLESNNGFRAVIDLEGDQSLTISEAVWWPNMGSSHETRRIIVKHRGKTCITLKWKA